MHIDWAIPCRYVEVHDNLGTIIGAGVETYWVRDLPATIQVVIAIRLLGMADELTEEVAHSSANRVRDPSGEIVSEIDAVAPRAIGVGLLVLGFVGQAIGNWPT